MKNLLLSKTPSGPLIDLGSENPNPILKPDDHPKKFINYAWGSKKVDYIPGPSNGNSIGVVEKIPLPSYDSLSEGLSILATDGTVMDDPTNFRASNKKAVALVVKKSSKEVSFMVALTMISELPWGNIDNCDTNLSLILPGYDSVAEAKADFESKKNTDIILTNIPNAGAASWCRSLSIPGLEYIEWDLPSVGILSILEETGNYWVDFMMESVPKIDESQDLSEILNNNGVIWSSTQDSDGRVYTKKILYFSPFEVKGPCEKALTLTLATSILPDSPIIEKHIDNPDDIPDGVSIVNRNGNIRSVKEWGGNSRRYHWTSNK